jgi:enoyl-CoA hydratase/carnithine racemase
MGKAVASHMLLNGGSITSSEAKSLGLVSHVWEQESFRENVADYLKKLAVHSNDILMLYKEMINAPKRKHLSEVHRMESKVLRKRWDDPNFKNIMKKFVKSPKF